MSGKFGVLFVFAVLINIGNPRHDDWEVRGAANWNAGNLKLNFVRATATKIYVEVFCDPSCTEISWDVTPFGLGYGFEVPFKVRQYKGDQYVIENLFSGAGYIIEARIKGSFDTIRAGTCSGFLRRLEDLRSVHNGPGWLDIRWKPYRSLDCRQDIEYLTRFKEEGGTFSEYRTYGWFPTDDKGNIHVGPTHPCDDWPKHFCLLLTDNVIAGKKYIVEILPRRIGGSNRTDVGVPETVEAYADPFNVQGAGDSGVHPQCQLWAWLAVGACIFCVAIIIGMLVTTLTTAFEKTQKLREEAENADSDDDNRENEETEETPLTTETRQSDEATKTEGRKEQKERKELNR